VQHTSVSSGRTGASRRPSRTMHSDHGSEANGGQQMHAQNGYGHGPSSQSQPQPQVQQQGQQQEMKASDIFAGLLPDARSATAFADVIKRAATAVAGATGGGGNAFSTALSGPFAGLSSSFPALPGSITRSGNTTEATRVGGGNRWAQSQGGTGAGDRQLARALEGYSGGTSSAGGRDPLDLGNGHGPVAVTIMRSGGASGSLGGHPGLNPASLGSSSSGAVSGQRGAGGGIGRMLQSLFLAMGSAAIRFTGERGSPRVVAAACVALVVLIGWYLTVQGVDEP
jgi:hypothetical protein